MANVQMKNSPFNERPSGESVTDAGAKDQNKFFVFKREKPINIGYKMMKNKPQTSTVQGGLFLMMVSGMHIGWGITTSRLSQQEWYLNAHPRERLWVVLSWYVGALMGNIVLSIVFHRMSKRSIYQLAGSLCALSSALMIAFPNNATMLIFIRGMAGLGHSFAFITGIVHASENCVKDCRNMIIISFPLYMLFGALKGCILVSSHYIDNTGPFNANQLMGLIMTIGSLVAILSAPCFTYESVVEMIQHGEYADAKFTMQRLRFDSVETPEIQDDFDELKTMIDEDATLSKSIFTNGNLRPLLMMILVRVAAVCATNYAMYMSTIQILSPILDEKTSPWVALIPRILGGIMSIKLTTTVQPKYLLGHSASQAGLMALMFTLGSCWSPSLTMQVAALGLGFFIGTGLLFVPDVMLVEAFPTPKKVGSIATVMSIEYVLHIVIIATTFHRSVVDYYLLAFYIFQIFLFVVSVAFYLYLPNTRLLTLREARIAFKMSGRSQTESISVTT